MSSMASRMLLGGLVLSAAMLSPISKTYAEPVVQQEADVALAGWSNWQPIDARVLPPNARPGVVSWGPGRLDVFQTDGFGQLTQTTNEGGLWSGAHVIGPRLYVSPVAATSWGAGSYRRIPARTHEWRNKRSAPDAFGL